MRRGFALAIVSLAVFPIFVFEPKHVPRELLAAMAVVCIAAPVVVFAIAAYQEQRRSSSSAGSRPTSSAKPTPDAGAEFIDADDHESGAGS